MKINIKEGCIGCELCVGACPSVFRMTDEGIAEVFMQPSQSDELVAQDAAVSCPVSVITLEN